jgi:uncharacterized protein (TIGR02284 family)
MNDDMLEHLKSLHTHAIDAHAGYQEALEDAEGKDLAGLFRSMMSIHTANADELSARLLQNGATADDDGSFMSTVHRSIMKIRSLFGGLGESVIPGLIDGEERNVNAYEDALGLPDWTPEIRAELIKQRDRLSSSVASMRAMPA